MALNILPSSQIQQSDIEAEKAKMAVRAGISGYGDPSVPDAQRSVLGDGAWAQQPIPAGAAPAIPLGAPQNVQGAQTYVDPSPAAPTAPASASPPPPDQPAGQAQPIFAPPAGAAPPAAPPIQPVPLPGPALLPLPPGGRMPAPIAAGTQAAPTARPGGRAFSPEQLNPPHPGGRTINPWTGAGMGGGGTRGAAWSRSGPHTANLESPIAMPKGGFKDGQRIQDGQMVQMQDGTFARYRSADKSFHPEEFNDQTGRFDNSAAIARNNQAVKLRQEVERENMKIQASYDEAVRKQDFEKARRIEQGIQAIAEIQANPDLSDNAKAHAVLQARLYIHGAASVESISKSMKTKVDEAREQEVKDLKEKHHEELRQMREEAALQKIQHDAEMADLKRQAMQEKADKEAAKAGKGPNTAEYLSIRKELTTVDAKTGTEKKPTHEEIMALWQQIHGDGQGSPAAKGGVSEPASPKAPAAAGAQAPKEEPPAAADASGGASEEQPQDVMFVADKKDPKNNRVEFSDKFVKGITGALGPYAKNIPRGKFIITPHDRELLKAGKPAQGNVFFEVPTENPANPKIQVKIPLSSLTPGYAVHAGLLEP